MSVRSRRWSEGNRSMAASAGSWFTNVKKNYKVTNTMPVPNQ